MNLTINDMRDVLKGQRRADEVIFWFCNAWHAGKGSDLYRIMKASTFTPRLHLQKQVQNDPEILYGFEVLGALYQKAYGPMVEYQLQPVPFAEIEEDDVLIHAKSPIPHALLKRLVQEFPCIEAGWPCRVYKWHGDLGVACAEGPSGASFHKFEVKSDGTVRGFWR